MKLLTAAVVFALAGGDGLELPLTDKARADWAQMIRGFRLNCPAVTHLYDHGEDAEGKVFRLSCQSLDGKSHWNIRAVIPAGRGSYMAPW
jgi:hypothetical protein